MANAKKSRAQDLAGKLRTESDSTVSVVKYSTARNAAQELDRLHEREIALTAEVQALKAELAIKNNRAIQDVAERNAFLKVHEKARQVLLVSGGHVVQTTQHLRELADSIEQANQFAGATE